MKIAMFTNTYHPHVGGVARSVQTLAETCREKGHEVRVIAPEFDGASSDPDVFRVPAIQHFNGSDFCVRLPVPNLIHDFLDAFQPDIIHTHHPFLLGDAALREAGKRRVPLVFTHHTLYERYTHYVPFDSPALKRIAIRMATEYCNLCSLVIAPSESVAGLLRERDVTAPLEVVPTGIDLDGFAGGDGNRFRQRFGIPGEAKVIGHVGRLAREKNLFYLAEAVVLRLREDPQAVFLLVGEGDHGEEMLQMLRNEVRPERLFAVGSQTGDDLADAYAAMDWFIFASQTETQGIVLAEAMAAGKPVVALDGPGVREILRDGENGYLLDAESTPLDFAISLASLMENPERSRRFAEGARRIVRDFGTDRCVQRMLDCYEALHLPQDTDADFSAWDRLRNGIQVEWDLFAARMAAASAAVIETPATEASLD